MDNNLDKKELDYELLEFEAAQMRAREKEKNSHSTVKMSKMESWLIKYSGGIIKDQKHASLYLMMLAVLAIIISMFFIFNSIRPESKFNLPREFIESADKVSNR